MINEIFELVKNNFICLVLVFLLCFISVIFYLVVKRITNNQMICCSKDGQIHPIYPSGYKEWYDEFGKKPKQKKEGETTPEEMTPEKIAEILKE